MDDVAEVPEPGDVGEDAGIAEVRSALAVQSRDRAVRLARASRIVFGLGVATAVLLVVVWVLGAVGTSESGFRILALAVVVLFGLAFLTGALSAAAARRFEAGVSDGRPPDAGSGS